mgnify:FL=1
MTTYTIPDVYQTSQTYQVTLDGDTYAFTLWWNLFGQRSYFTISDQFGNRVLTKAMVGSSTTEGVAPINLVEYYFSSTLYYYPENQVMVVLP